MTYSLKDWMRKGGFNRRQADALLEGVPGGTSLPSPTTGDAGKVLTVNGTEDGFELDPAGGAAAPAFGFSGTDLPPIGLFPLDGGYLYAEGYAFVTADHANADLAEAPGMKFLPFGRSGSCTFFQLAVTLIDLTTFAAPDTQTNFTTVAEWDFTANQATMPPNLDDSTTFGANAPTLGGDTLGNGIKFRVPGCYHLLMFMGGVVLDPT